MTLKYGSTVVTLVPQDSNGSRMFVGGFTAMEDKSHEEWRALEADKAAMKQLYGQDLRGWPDLVHSAVENIDLDKAYIWPFHTMPRLDSWTSTCGRVGILGDAAHALSPITGQGVNQAFEDAYMLALVLAKAPSKVSHGEVLAFWQDQRMARVHEIVDKLMGPSTPKGPQLETKSSLSCQPKGASGRGDAWLYRNDIDRAVDAWIRSKA